MTSWEEVTLWRVQTIVRHALTIAFMALTLIPLYKLTNSEPNTIRIGSAFIILFSLYDMVRERKRDPKVWDSFSWYLFMFMCSLIAVPMVVNLWVTSLGWLQLGFVFILTSPAAIFYNFVRELGQPKLSSKTKIKK